MIVPLRSLDAGTDTEPVGVSVRAGVVAADASFEVSISLSLLEVECPKVCGEGDSV